LGGMVSVKNLEKVVEVKGKKFLFTVEASKTSSDYLKYEELRNEIWRFPEDHLPGCRNMMCENFLHEGSTLFIGLFVETEGGEFKQDKAHIIGFSYGFVGVKDKRIAFKALGNLQFYSQYIGIREDFRNHGLGILIKEFQRKKVRDLFGIYTITCTYDPLTGINAYRNIHYFGMKVLEYRASIYGEFGGLLNRMDVPRDRFFVFWDLRRKVQRPEYDLEALLNSQYRVIKADTVEVQGQSGPHEVEVVQDVDLSLNREFLLVQIPFDFYRMLNETDVEDPKVRRIPVEWRIQVRKVFQHFFGKNYKIIDFRHDEGIPKRDFYVLKK
jgi:predicted GNAT superfamily acetyltransferase